MHIRARRVFRLSLVVALSLAVGYGLKLPLPFIAPLFAVLLTIAPGPPLGLKKLIALLIVIVITLGVGILLIPLLQHYPISAVLLVGLGLFLSFHLMVNKGKMLPGLFLAIGFTMISAAGLVADILATLVIQSLLIGIVVAIACQWLVYPLFPEDPAPDRKKPQAAAAPDPWIAVRATLIALPAYLAALTNPTLYMPLIIKSMLLGQQSSVVTVRNAGWELLGSTLLGGLFAILFWMALGMAVNLWMFFLWMLLFGIYFAAKIYGVIASRYPASFWQNVLVTLLILLGSAVMDSENGKDVYTAFAVRMGLFILVTLYAWLAVYLLDRWRHRRNTRKAQLESVPC